MVNYYHKVTFISKSSSIHINLYLIMLYVTMWKMLEHKEKPDKFIKWPILTNLHKFITHSLVIVLLIGGSLSKAHINSTVLYEWYRPK